jgi:hypothetical protein
MHEHECYGCLIIIMLQVMSGWSQLPRQTPIVAVHASIIPGTNKVLYMDRLNGASAGVPGASPARAYIAGG